MTPRELAPVATVENCERLFREALAEKKMLEYRRTERTRKHSSVDSFSVSAVVQVFDKVKPELKARLIQRSQGNCGLVAIDVWKLIGALKEKA